jgi:ribosomal protein S18 acetylase RimI-like enzyme
VSISARLREAVVPLDNIMWHALSGVQRHLAQGDDRARRYPSDIGPFSAVPDEPRSEHYDALRELVGAGNVATLFRGDVVAPEDWEVLGAINGVQMVGPTVPYVNSVDARIITLGANDVDDMMSLTSRTKPGPFAIRTWQLGTYLGVRVEGRLVAMAGQRAQTADYVEISAVCTDEEFGGRGLGRALVQAQVGIILEAGKVPVLHASATNARAIALYEHLGFQHRRTVGGAIMRAPL